MKGPVKFKCPDCQCMTTLSSDSHAMGVMFFLPNFCGHCGAQNPDNANMKSRDEWVHSIFDKGEE